jgi:PHD/YefM family antitoxin component YafN of YafNO toxin-antitoxin module
MIRIDKVLRKLSGLYEFNRKLKAYQVKKHANKSLKRNAVSEEDWRAIEETLYLLSIPGMRKSIRKGLKIPIEKCNEEPGW